MIDEEFCWQLELKISQVLENTTDKNLKGFWCDGILIPDSQKELTAEYINEHKQITMTALVGADGQDEFELTLHFGPKALTTYESGPNLDDCLPTIGLKNSIAIDGGEKRINVQLE